MTKNLTDTVAGLNEALDGLARALASGSSDAVLHAEAPVASAVSSLLVADRPSPAPGHDLRQAIVRARATLAQCQALGRSADELARTVFPETAYGRGGHPMATSAPRRNLFSVT